jgi:hypothetical protein
MQPFPISRWRRLQPASTSCFHWHATAGQATVTISNAGAISTAAAIALSVEGSTANEATVAIQ